MGARLCPGSCSHERAGRRPRLDDGFDPNDPPADPHRRRGRRSAGVLGLVASSAVSCSSAARAGPLADVLFLMGWPMFWTRAYGPTAAFAASCAWSNTPGRPTNGTSRRGRHQRGSSVGRPGVCNHYGRACDFGGSVGQSRPALTAN